jgi:hypothetical protein
MATPVVVKEFFANFLIFAKNAAGINASPLVEDDDTLRNAPIGSTDGGTTFKNIKVEVTGEQDIVLHGKDSGGAIDPLLTNINKALIVDTSGGKTPFQVDPQLVPAVEADLWDPGGAAGDIFDVEFLIVNIDASAPVDVTIGQDIGGGDTALEEYEKFMDAEIVPAKASSGWRGPFRIGGDDHVRGVASAANDANIHFRITRVVNV